MKLLYRLKEIEGIHAKTCCKPKTTENINKYLSCKPTPAPQGQ